MAFEYLIRKFRKKASVSSGGATAGPKQRRKKKKKPRRGAGRKPSKTGRKRRGGTHKPSAELIGSYNPYGNGQPAKKKLAAPEDDDAAPAAPAVAPAVAGAGAASAGPDVTMTPSVGPAAPTPTTTGTAPVGGGAGETDPVAQLTQRLDALDLRTDDQRRGDFAHRHDTQCRKIITVDGAPRRCRRTARPGQLYCWQHDPSYIPKPKSKKQPGSQGPTAPPGPGTAP